jgi:hypothetical protein
MRSDLTFLFAFIAVVCTSVIPAIAAPVLGDSLQQFEVRESGFFYRASQTNLPALAF